MTETFPPTAPSPSAPGTTMSTATQNTVRMTGLLRLVLLADGIGCIGMGLAMLPLTGWLEETLGLPSVLLIALAAYLVAYGAAETFVGTRQEATRSSVIALIVLNAMWVLDSAIVLAAGWFSPTDAGTITIAVLAAGVLGVTALQAFAYRRA
jgi:hypothetical protein